MLSHLLLRCFLSRLQLLFAFALALAFEIGPGFSPDIHPHHEFGL
jgi:hypothetical protein